MKKQDSQCNAPDNKLGKNSITRGNSVAFLFCAKVNRDSYTGCHDGSSLQHKLNKKLVDWLFGSFVTVFQSISESLPKEKNK